MKTPHRIPAITPEAASPLGEGEEGVAREEKTPHPNPFPQERRLRNPRVGARKTLTPTLSHGEREQERPRFRNRGGVLQRSPRRGLKRGAGWRGGDPSPISAADARVCLSPWRG